MSKALTRAQYMAHEVTHDEFYGQFVTQAVIAIVSTVIGVDRIKSSTDEHFNDISMSRWDRLRMQDYIDRDLLREALEYKDPSHFPWSPCTNVCIAKAAAKRIKETTNGKA